MKRETKQQTCKMKNKGFMLHAPSADFDRREGSAEGKILKGKRDVFNFDQRPTITGQRFCHLSSVNFSPNYKLFFLGPIMVTIP